MCSISFLASFTYPWTFFLSGQWILHCLQTSPSHRRLRQWGGPFSPQLPVTAFCHLSQWWLHFSSCVSKEAGSHPSLLFIWHIHSANHIGSTFTITIKNLARWSPLRCHTHQVHHHRSPGWPQEHAQGLCFCRQATVFPSVTLNATKSVGYRHFLAPNHPSLPIFSPKETHSSSHDLLDPKWPKNTVPQHTYTYSLTQTHS